MYVIKPLYKGESVYFISKEIEPRFKLPLIKFSASISGATKFDDLDVVVCKCKELLNYDFKIYPVCPICGLDYVGHPAISRKNNKTKLCPNCGIKEALNDYIKSIK